MMATAVYAIVGTQMFSSEESELFGNFSRFPDTRAHAHTQTHVHAARESW